MTITDTERGARYDELAKKWQPDPACLEDEPAPILLISEATHDGRIWFETFEDEDGFHAHEHDDPVDWRPRAAINLDSGKRYDVVVRLSLALHPAKVQAEGGAA